MEYGSADRRVPMRGPQLPYSGTYPDHITGSMSQTHLCQGPLRFLACVVTYVTVRGLFWAHLRYSFPCFVWKARIAYPLDVYAPLAHPNPHRFSLRVLFRAITCAMRLRS